MNARLRSFVVGAVAAASGLATITAASPQRGAPPPPPQPVQASGQAPAEPTKGTGLLLGQVIDATSKRPIAGAIVNLSGGLLPSSVVMLPSGEMVSNTLPLTSSSDAPRQIITDAEGHFMFRSLATGRYSMSVQAPGFISGGYGQNRPAGTSQSIELTRDDEKRGDLIVRLWKSGSISGRVVDEAGEPVVEFPVRLFRRTVTAGRPRLSPMNFLTTDDRGVYRAASLIPGEYVVAVLSTQTTIPASTVEAYRDRTSSAGAAASAELSRELSSSGGPSPFSSGYRVGDLILQIGMGRGGSAGYIPPPLDGKIAVYPAQFYPSTSVASQAAIITLASGEDRGGIDLHLKLAASVRVSGSLTGPDGPAKNLGVRLLPLGFEDFTSESGVEIAVTATDVNGAFTFLGVPPGQYVMRSLRVPRAVATPMGSSATMVEVSGPGGMIMSMGGGSGIPAAPPPLPVDPTLWATMTISVGESDLVGLAVTLRPGARLSGRLVFEGAAAQPTPEQIQRTSLQISPLTGSGPLQISTAAKRVETDGRFATIGYPAGKYRISAALPPMQAGSLGWRLKSVMVGGREVSEDGFTVDTEDLSGIVVTFTDKATQLTGTVTDGRGQPDPNANVVVLPADSDAWRQGIVGPRRVRSVRTTTGGSFSIADLPPGAYYIAAVSDDSLVNLQDPKSLEAVVKIASRFTIAEGEKVAQALSTRIIR